MRKNESGEIKKYGNFELAGKQILKNKIIDQSHVVHKNLATPLSLGPLKCCNVKWEAHIWCPPITIDTTTFTRRCYTPRLIVPFDQYQPASSPALLHFST